MTVQEIADLAVGFWVRDWDQRNTQVGMIDLDEHTVMVTPTAGMRVWIYVAEMPWDPRDGPQAGRAPVGWCASDICPGGEYGVIHTDDGTYQRISKTEFLDAAEGGWPEWGQP